VTYSALHDVATFHALNGDLVTLAAPGYHLSDVQVTAAPANLTGFVWGLFSFAVSGVTPGGSVAVTVTLPAGEAPMGYFKVDPAAGTSSPFTFNGTTGAELHANSAVLHLVDGGPGDSDNTVNGIITDPGGFSQTCLTTFPPSLVLEPDPREIVGTAPGAYDHAIDTSIGESPAGVRYTNGALDVTSTDLSSAGFGTPWGATRGWTNAFTTTGSDGNGIVVDQLPYAVPCLTSAVAIVTSTHNARMYDLSGGVYVPRYFTLDTLVANTGANEFDLTDTTGAVIRFNNFSTSLPANERGTFKSYTDPYGNVTSVTSVTSDGRPGEVQRSATVGGTTYTESYLYTHLTTGPNTGLVSNITLRRSTNGGSSWTTVRQTAYSYYDGTLANGNQGDLLSAVVEDGNGNALDTSYYRYYTSNIGTGYQGGLKYVVNPQSYARLTAAVGNVQNATDAQVATYADAYYEYANMKVTKAVIQGAGCSCGGGSGQGTFLNSYSTSTNPNGTDSWSNKVIETLSN
jgi:hypothetical protein